MKNETRKVLFLDFDGVMITEFGTQVHEELGSTEDEFGPLFDPHAEEALKDLEKEFSFDIVVTSNRRYVGLETLRAMWKKRGLAGNLYDITPLHVADQAIAEGEKDSGNIKVIEIKAWLAQHPEVEKYAIVDDEPQAMIRDIALSKHVAFCHKGESLADQLYTIVRILRGVNYQPIKAPKEFRLFNKDAYTHKELSKNKLLYTQIANLPLTYIRIKMGKGFLGWLAKKVLKKNFCFVDELPYILDYYSVDEYMDQVMQNVIRIYKNDTEQVALAYGLAMLITMQTNDWLKKCRYHEFLGLLCSISISLKEVEMAKMLMRLMEGSWKDDVQYEWNIDSNFYKLEKEIENIPKSEAKDNRLSYFELICELRRHWNQNN